MKITEIIARNIGGKDFQHNLSAVNIIVGRNASGKTAISNSIKAGLFGYLPRLGKQPGATYKLAGENRSEMNIALRLESKKGEDYLGSMVAHTWKRDPKGSISYNVEGALSVPVVLLDTRDYFQRTSADRIKFIFDKIDPTKYGWNDSQLFSKLTAIEVIPASIGTVAVREMMKLVMETVAYRDSTSQSHQSWLEGLADKLKDKRKEFDIAAKQFGSSGIRKSIPAFKPQDNSVRITELEKILTELRANIATEEATKEAWEKNEPRRKALQEIINLKDWNDNRESLKKEIESLNVIVKAYSSLTRDLKKDFNLAKSQYETIKQQITETTEAITDKENKLAVILKSKCCPFCKSDKVGWEKAIETDHRAVLAKLESSKAELIESKKQCELRGADLKRRLTKSEADDLANTKNVDSLQTFEKALQESEAIATGRNTAQAELDGLNASAAKPDETKLASLKADLEAKQIELAGAQKIKQEFAYYVAVKDKADESERAYTEKFTHAEVYKIAVKETLAVQERLVSLAFCQILEKATALTDGLLRAKLDYKDGELGMMLPEGWVSHETFSGWEEMLAYSGLSVALAQESPIKIVIMDELGRIDEGNKKLLITRMDMLTRNGVLDQFIGIDVSAKDYYLPPTIPPSEPRLIVDGMTVITP